MQTRTSKGIEFFIFPKATGRKTAGYFPSTIGKAVGE
jgi:hypothetical protein